MPNSQKEAPITISGATLTSAQSSVVRVAIGDSLLFLSNKENREYIGEALAQVYQERLTEVMKLILLTAQ